MNFAIFSMKGEVPMKVKSFWVFMLVGVIILFSSCANRGMFLSLNQTQVQLSKPNFHIVATNVQGEARAGYLLGISYSLGSAAETVALARVSGKGLLYKEALENLWENYEREHGRVEGKKLALANVRYDSDILNLLVYTEVRIIVRADIIEFQK